VEAHPTSAGILEIIAIEIGYTPSIKVCEAIRRLKVTELVSITARTDGPRLIFGIGSTNAVQQRLTLLKLS